MTRIQKAFENKKAFIAFVTGGDPDVETTKKLIPAIESAHAVAYGKKLAPTMDKDQIIVINISGRGDKDVAAIARYRGVEIFD